MPQSTAIAIAEKAAELSGKKVHLEVLDFDKDEFAVSQSVNEKVGRILDEDLPDEQEEEEQKGPSFQGIDY